MNTFFLTTFWEVMVWIFWVWLWMMVIWMFIAVFADIFRRRDHSGLAKAGWTAVIFLLPLLGVLIYMIVRPRDATAEQDAEILAMQKRAAGYSATAEIEKAQQLLASGAITQAEFDRIKQTALISVVIASQARKGRARSALPIRMPRDNSRWGVGGRSIGHDIRTHRSVQRLAEIVSQPPPGGCDTASIRREHWLARRTS